MTTFTPLKINGAFIVQSKQFEDKRGKFIRSYCEKEFEKINHNTKWVHINLSQTVKKGSIRGMHMQVEPYSEVKLIRCIRGVVFDVIIDMRKDSDTYLQHEHVIISAENMLAVYIPKGCAHGFQTLEDDSHLLYFHSNFYSKDSETGYLYNDPTFNISWPLDITVISEKDSSYLPIGFKYINL
jgi:dTDP-4-dehydrorhamnose 3,5-epimerase